MQSWRHWASKSAKTSLSKRSSAHWPILIALIALGFTLRVYHLDASPLRGDEAFAVRYWAAPPADVLRQLAWIEPHPFGTFFGFWAWKSLVGGGEFTMRMLPALINLLGVPTLYVLGRRLFDDQVIGLIGAFLWAINPNLIWHSQDVRNYAIWAALSAISMWLLLRAADRARRIDWILYIISATLTLYIFFLEVVLVVVHGLYILLFRRRALRPWLVSMVVVAVLLIPWFGQLWALAHSGYGGAASGADLGKLVTQFLPSLAFGEWTAANLASVPGLLLAATILFGVCLLILTRRCPPVGKFLALWLIVPAVLVTVAATRLNVFLPRYLIAITPTILLPLAWLPTMLRDRGTQSKLSRGVSLITVDAITIVYVVSMVSEMLVYYSSVFPTKAPDWYSLRDFLRDNTTNQDTVIMTSLDPQTGNADPAFEYYYSGPAQIVTLPHPGIDIETVVRKALSNSRAVWFIVSGSNTETINGVLLADGALISDQGVGRSFIVRQYRTPTPDLVEMDAPLDLSFGDAHLSGYSLTGRGRSAVTVLLFGLNKQSKGLTSFVHLIGPPRPNGSPLWAQDDHPPVSSGWDAYHLDLSPVLPGEYTIEIGLYDPKTGQRVTITDGKTGKALGDSYNLTTITVK